MPAGRILAYGALGLPLAFAALPVYVHVPRFYAEVGGLPLALLGVILLGARLFDALLDPCLGWLADRVPRRRMLGLALLPFALGFVALMNPPGTGAAIWLLVSLALTYLGFSAATIAYQAWGADIASNSALRTRLTAAREGFGLLGVLLAAALPGLLGGSVNEGIARLGWLLPPILLVAIALSWFGVPAGAVAPVSGEALLPSLQRMLANTAFRRLLLIFVANGIAAALPATLFLFFVADVLQVETAAGPLLALYFLAGAASLPLWVRLALRYGRVPSWLAAMLLSMLAFAGAGMLGNGDLAGFAVICLASGLALGADLALPTALAADLGETQGQAGVCFGVWNLVAKFNLALAAGLSLPLIDALGYVPGSGLGLPALVFAYALLPLAFKLLAAVLLWRWRHSLELQT